MADQYKVPCLTEGVDVFVYADAAPTECPNDSAHTIDGPGVALADSLAFRFKEENAVSTTTSETYQNKVTLAPATGLAAGVYLLSWTCEHRITPAGDLNSRVQTRFRVDGTTKGSTASVSEQWEVHSGWDRFFANDGDKPSLTLDYRRDPGLGGNDTVEIRKARLAIQYIGTN